MGNAESTPPADESQVQQPQEQQQRQRAGGAAATTDDEPWWNDIEHENLVLQQAPTNAATSTPKRVVEAVKVAEEKATNREEPIAMDSKEESPKREQTLEEFREELRTKREARQTAVQDLREEMNCLRRELAKEQADNRRLRKEQGEEERPAEQVQEQPLEQPPQHPLDVPKEQPEIDPDDENPSSRSRHANIELANAQLALQQANAENLSLRGEVEVVQRQVGTLKEVISCCKQMLSVKEEQCAQLKMKLQQIENSFSEREMKIMSNNLRQEYERQLVNIRQLRQLYEERQRVAAAEYENLQRLISIKKDELIAEQEKTKNFEERNQTLLKEVETANEQLSKLREECGELKYEKRMLNEQVGAVNMLFSQLIMGFNGKSNMDIDRLNQMLEENRQLLNQMTQAEGSCSDGATLPKLLFELVEEATGSGGSGEDSDKSRSATPTPRAVAKHEAAADTAAVGVDVDVDMPDCVQRGGGGGGAAEPEIMGKVASAQEIIGNLPKVWKVLMELLSHHKIERVQFEELPQPARGIAAGAAAAVAATGEAGKAAALAKPAELSVSKTYIKLKDLILEKKSLVKETNRLKTLNSHLDYRLNEQEKRLSAVSLELTKTWHLVGKMQRQHRQLHTQEQILRYQLQQKRRLLSELKDELEYCRRKWAAARAKNEETQEQCDDWRREFARRKLEDANHSAESGYSDSGPQSDEERDSGRAEEQAAAEPVVEAVTPPSTSGNCRRKHLRDQFEHTRKIKRMQSTSPGRQAAAALASGSAEEEGEEIVLRWNSAPPTCGWRGEAIENDEDELDVGAEDSRGAIPKTPHSSRSRQRSQAEEASTSGTASRIQKLEEQCKSLIQQVLETSDNRERLEVQLCRFQDEVSPAQHAVPLDDFINNKRLERMTRASSAPATGSLTPREEEYTRKRSERLGRLEEESRQLMSRIRRTTDRGHYLKKSLDRIRRAPSRDASFESNTEETAETEETKTEETASPLTADEEAYTSRRAARLRRLEQESQQLLAQLSKNSERSEGLANKLDTLHERQQQQQQEQPITAAAISQTVEQRLEDIERVSVNRAERLRLMEAQGNELIARLSNTSERGTAMINRMAEREASRRQEAELVEQTLPTEEVTSSVKNIASTRIADEAEGAACCVTVTTTATQQAMQQQAAATGAIPKKPPRSTPQAHLCAASRQDDAAKKRSTDKESAATNVAPETLEDMVQRLRSLPFPAEQQTQNVAAAETREEEKAAEEEQQEDAN